MRTPATPVTIYTPESPLLNPAKMLRDLLRDLSASRELGWRLFLRDINAQYRQTLLGYVWLFLPPLSTSLIFVFLNANGIVRIENTGIPYAAFAMIGTLLWQTFVDAMQAPLQAVNSAKTMLAKINFPRESLLLGALYTVVFSFLIRLVLLVAVLLIWKITPSSTLLIFPLAMAALIVLGFTIGLALCPVGALYGDISRGIPIIAQFWMLLTPVVYPARTAGLAGFLATWNPVAPVITTAREALTGHVISLLPSFALVSTVACLAAFLGLIVFRLAMPIVIERMGG